MSKAGLGSGVQKGGVSYLDNVYMSEDGVSDTPISKNAIVTIHIVRFYIPRYDYYAFRITVNSEKHILYMETLYPGARYVYQLGKEHFTPDSDRVG